MPCVEKRKKGRVSLYVEKVRKEVEVKMSGRKERQGEVVSQTSGDSYTGQWEIFQEESTLACHAMQKPTPPAPGIPSPGTVFLYSSSLRNIKTSREPLHPATSQRGVQKLKVKKGIQMWTVQVEPERQVSASCSVHLGDLYVCWDLKGTKGSGVQTPLSRWHPWHGT
jgi:hypothetical protein